MTSRPFYRFHTSIHRRPPQCAAGPTVDLAGTSFATLTVTAEQLGTTTFERTFEAVAADLARFERLYIEPDGSFVWVASQQEPAWQVDGMIYDHEQRVHLIDLKGTCPGESLDRLLGVLGWPGATAIFSLVPMAVLLDEAEFRRYAQLPHCA